MERIYPREKYLSRIRPFYDSSMVKVFTGIRRAGKSCIMKSIVRELEEDGKKERIVYVPLDRHGYRKIKDIDALEKEIDNRLRPGERNYIFIDEVQNVPGFEEIVLEYEEEGHSVFLTGSNSYLLSEEITTKLTGRYLSFEIQTLDFGEYLDFKRFLGITVQDDVEAEFEAYLREGGFPEILSFPDVESKRVYVENLLDEILKKDVKYRHQLRNLALYERVLSYVVGNFSSPFSITRFHESIERQGVKVKLSTLRNYVYYLENAKIVYECNRFDLKSRKSLEREQKYYLADLSIYLAVSPDGRTNLGSSLENLVYLYLKGKGYRVSVGRISDLEIDFIVEKRGVGYAYVQVSVSTRGSDETAEREYRPFRRLKDGYPRYLISLDRFPDQKEGVIHLNAIDLFLGKKNIF